LIVRISRGRIRRGHEAEAFGLLRETVVAGQGTTPGLVAFVIARRMVEGQLELVAMTTWHDLESSSVEHLETIAESFRGLADIDPDAPDLLTPTEPQ
jgi:hypothetical protein